MRKEIALTALAMVPFSISHANEVELVGVVTAETLNARSGTGYNDKILFSLKKDDKVLILDINNGWSKIRTNEGKEGWISSTYLEIIEGEELFSLARSSYIQKQVNTNGLNMRSGPGTSYRILTTINKGTKLDVISESNGWSKINYNGRVGYVYSTYLDSIQPVYTNLTSKIVNTNGLNVRSGPSTSYSVVASLSKGSKVSVISESNGWSKILYKNKERYVSSRYLDSENSSSQGSSTDTKPSAKETKIVNTEGLNVRSGPSTSYSKLGSLSKGSKVSVISESNGWTKILYKEKEAYVSSMYLDSEKSNSQDSSTESKPTIKETKIVNTEGLNVRSGPSTSYSKLGSLSKGSKVSVISESNGWTKILYKEKEAYVSSMYLDSEKSNSQDSSTESKPTIKETKIVNTEGLNVRSGPSTSYSKLGSLNKGSKVSVISESNGWTKILYKEKEAYVYSKYLDEEKLDSEGSDSNGTSSDVTISTSGIINNVYLNYTLEEHVNKQYNSKANTSNGKYATKEQIEEKLNTNKILSSSSYGKLQFLRVDKYTDGITASEINSFLNKKVSSSNVFYNKGQQFIDAAKKYDIDVVYLVSHCMWETGYGSSTLAKGQTITTYKGQPLSKPVVVYNFFGIGAFDGTANLSGGEYAYKQGWTTIDATIDGSAKWIATNYIKRSGYNQNTVYKMKWNNATHQYATDVNWCNGVASVMNGLIGYYEDQSKLTYDIIRYK